MFRKKAVAFLNEAARCALNTLLIYIERVFLRGGRGSGEGTVGVEIAETEEFGVELDAPWLADGGE